MQTLNLRRRGQEGPRFEITGPLSFSDQIAFDQFVLAVERNFLLHITAGLNMTVVGLAMFRFFSKYPSDFYEGVGIGAFLMAVAVIAKGAKDFYLMRKDMQVMEEMIESHRERSSRFRSSG